MVTLHTVYRTVIIYRIIDYIDIFEVTLTFEMSTVRGHTNGCSFESVKVFETENAST